MVTISGKIIEILPLRVVPKNWKIRDFGIQLPQEDDYPQQRKLQAVLGAIKQLEDVRPGDFVVCEIRFRGRKYRHASGEMKYYNIDECLTIRKTHDPSTFLRNNPGTRSVLPEVEPTASA